MLSDMFQFDAFSARAIVNALLERGCLISVHDGEERVVTKSDNASKILDTMGNTEADQLTVFNMAKEKLGSFYLVYGNGPGELVADYTANAFCESIMRRCGLAGY